MTLIFGCLSVTASCCGKDLGLLLIQKRHMKPPD